VEEEVRAKDFFGGDLFRKKVTIGSNFDNLSFSFFRKRKIQNDFCFCGIMQMQSIWSFLYSKSRLGQFGVFQIDCTRAAF